MAIGFKQYLQEKLVMFNHGATYGQVVFLAGGAASGKGFSRESFMENHKFKIRDVDDWKLAFLKLQKLKGQYPELKDLDLKQPQDVFKLHTFVKKLGVKEKTLDMVLGNARNPETLPNIMFDVTLKDAGDITEVIPELLKVGYKKENIHITWILADYHVAVKANKTRARVVPDDILLNTHEGAANTMFDILNGNVPEGVDGDIKVVLNNREHTVMYGQSANAAEKNKGKEFNIGGFTYITVKKSGKPIAPASQLKERLHQWIGENVPESSGIKHLFKKEEPEHKELPQVRKAQPSNDNSGRGYHQMAAQDRQSYRPQQQGGPSDTDPANPRHQQQRQESGLVSIHRRHGGRVGFAFKTQNGKIGFSPQEAEKKIDALKRTFPSDQFVTIPYVPHKNNKNY